MTIIIFCALLISNITIYAVSDVTEKAFNSFFEKTSEENKEYEKLCDDGYIEYVYKPETTKQEEVAETFIEIKDEDDGTNETIIEKITSNTEKIMAIVYAEEKGTINVAVVTDDDKMDIRVGLIEPDDTIRYVDGSQAIT